MIGILERRLIEKGNNNMGNEMQIEKEKERRHGKKNVMLKKGMKKTRVWKKLERIHEVFYGE